MEKVVWRENKKGADKLASTLHGFQVVLKKSLLRSARAARRSERIGWGTIGQAIISIANFQGKAAVGECPDFGSICA